MIKVTLEFHSVPEAIIALNAVMNLPEVKASPVATAIAEVKAARRGRADKGQKRGEYKPRTEPAAPQAGLSGGSTPDVTDSQPPLQACETPAAAAPIPAEIVKAEVQKQQQANELIKRMADPTPASPATIGEKDAEAQKAMEILHGKKGLDACRVLLGQFGVSRIREIPTARRSEFLEEAKKAAA